MPLSAEQREQRANRVGASEIGSIAGLGPRRPIDVFLQHVGRAEFEGNDQTEIGHEVEGVMSRWYWRRHAAELTRLYDPERSYTRPEFPRAIATPDRIAQYADGRIARVEVKNVGYRMMHHWRDGVPDYVVAQTLLQGLLTGIEPCVVVALLGGRDPIERPVEYDHDLALDLYSIAERFIVDHVLPHVPPPPDDSEAYARYLRDRYPRSLDNAIEATDEADAWAVAYRDAHEHEKDARAAKREAANHLMAIMGEADAMTAKSREWSVTWRAPQRGRVNWEAVARDLAQDAAQVEAAAERHRSEPVRVFRQTWRSESGS